MQKIVPDVGFSLMHKRKAVDNRKPFSARPRIFKSQQTFPDWDEGCNMSDG